MDPCLSEDEVAALIDGALGAERFAGAERHIAGCGRCLRLVEEVGRALGSGDPASGPGPGEAPELVRGTRVGRYEVLGPLGAGGMGRVYAARDSALDRRVALKLLHPTSTTADLEARLLREAKTMARLSHPEVITIYDVGHHGEQLFIAMELVEGGTLRQWLAAAPRRWREILALYVRAGRGLARAHAAGIIHRDFKPDNVLVAADGEVRVTDFGLARAAHAGEPATPAELPMASTVDLALTQTGALVGTPAYMAPEQHVGAPADARSDLYSFCVSLHEALCGVRPFAGSTLAALQEAKLAGRIGGAPKGGAPPRLLRVIAVGLRARPEARYASMDELLARLERAARVPWWPVAVGVTAIVVVGGAGAMAARGRQTAPLVTAPVGCTSHRACVEQHGGEPFVCRASDHACVAVASPDCTAEFEPDDLTHDDTVWLGAMFPAKGALAASFGTMNFETIDFARRELAQATKALHGTDGAPGVRRIALVACDDSADAPRAARHLVDVGVPAVLGLRSGQEVVDLAGSVFMPNQIVTVASLTSSPLVTRLPQSGDGPRMVWRTTYNLDAVADTIARVTEQILAPRYAGGPLRVTLVRTDSAGALSFAERLFRTLRFNGKPAVANAGSYAEVTFPPGALPAAEVARIAERAADTRPGIVVMQGDESTMVPVMERIEARMANAPHKPTYLGALYTTDTFASFIGDSADRRHRVYTVESLSNSVANARFVIRYNEAHAKKVTRTVNGGPSYDAFYALAYATFALGREPVTGPALARAFGRLIGPGRTIAVGPSDVFDAITALGQGESIDLDGTQSGLDFDLATGDEPSDFELLCSGVDAQGRATGEDVESGVVFTASTKKLEGTLRCP